MKTWKNRGHTIHMLFLINFNLLIAIHIFPYWEIPSHLKIRLHYCSHTFNKFVAITSWLSNDRLRQEIMIVCHSHSCVLVTDKRFSQALQIGLTSFHSNECGRKHSSISVATTINRELLLCNSYVRETFMVDHIIQLQKHNGTYKGRRTSNASVIMSILGFHQQDQEKKLTPRQEKHLFFPHKIKSIGKMLNAFSIPISFLHSFYSSTFTSLDETTYISSSMRN